MRFDKKKDVVDYLRGLGLLECADKTKRVFFIVRGCCALSHGEYSEPELHPRRYKDGWGIHRQLYYYPGTLNRPWSGRIDIYRCEDGGDYEIYTEGDYC